jgi:hypothetical protein|tara:strand:- start:270 stop:671 length:402 start_codon:yes stop_codon:yes gene_type:complete
MSIEFEIFEGKSLSSLFEDIYKNSKTNKTQLELLVKEVASFIKDGDMAVQLIPMIKEYLEINVKNDEQLVKLAQVVQRLIAAESRSGAEGEFLLSDREKEQLVKDLDSVVGDLQKRTDDITQEIEAKQIPEIN